MLKIEQVSKVFYPGTVNEKTALEDINLHVNEGDIITVVGSNGSGKSTLFNLISGTYPVTGGTLVLDGKDVTNAPEYKRAFTIGRIFQDPTKGTAAKMSIEDNMITAYRKGMRGLTISLNNEMRDFFADELKQLSMGLELRLKDNVGLLSGGQRQRIGIARALYRNPSVLVMDEATSALDNQTEKDVMAAIDGLSGKKTIILIAHRLSTLKKCDQIFYLEKGVITRRGTYEELFADET